MYPLDMGTNISLQDLHPKFYASKFLKQTKLSVDINKTKMEHLKYLSFIDITKAQRINSLHTGSFYNTNRRVLTNY